MKKTILIIGLIIMFILLNYNYYENKTTEVLLSGQVVGFNIKNIEENVEENNKLTVQTSSKSVGTMTFIKENNEFVALGHTMSGEETELDGECYEIRFEDVIKSTNNRAGRIIAEIDEKAKIGEVYGDSDYGIYGKVENILTEEYKKIKTANRYDINKGQAYVFIDLDGSGLKSYEIEITDIDYLSSTQNIRISVKSEELIELTGGIVQGMSGAPIVQNGELIGAINSVNVNNSLDAYAIFIDKLI